MLDSFLLIDSLNLTLSCSIYPQSLWLLLLLFQAGSLIPNSVNIGLFLDQKVMKILQPMKWNFYIIHSCDKFITALENCFTGFYCHHLLVVDNEKNSLTIFFTIKGIYRIFMGFQDYAKGKKPLGGIRENLVLASLRIILPSHSLVYNPVTNMQLIMANDLSEPHNWLLSLWFASSVFFSIFLDSWKVPFLQFEN